MASREFFPFPALAEQTSATTTSQLVSTARRNHQSTLDHLMPEWAGTSTLDLRQKRSTTLGPAFIASLPQPAPRSSVLRPDPTMESFEKEPPYQEGFPLKQTDAPPPINGLQTTSSWPNSFWPVENTNVAPAPLLNRISRVPNYPTPFDASPASREEARMNLEAHMRDRWPQVTSASEMLQKMTDVRCEQAFEIPNLPASSSSPLEGKTPLGANPSLRHLRSGGEFKLRAPLTEVGGGLSSQCSSPELGLREQMLLHGKQPYGNQKITELRSLSLHDWTPNVRTGAFQNELVVHYEAGDGCRLAMYEVNLPIAEQPLHVLPTRPKTERWIWFLISSPVVMLHQPTRKDPTPRFPPSLSPDAIPNSWVVFAAPFETKDKHPMFSEVTTTQSVIVHPLQIDVLSCSNHNAPRATQSNHNIIRSPFLPSSFNSAGIQPPQKPDPNVFSVWRQDYDFCKHGVPAFEVSGSADRIAFIEALNREWLERDDILCAKDLEGYGSLIFDNADDSDGDADSESSCSQTSMVHRSMKRSGHRRGHSNSENKSPLAHKSRGIGNGLGATSNQVKSRQIGDSSLTRREEKWWGEVKEKLTEDAARWRRIRAAMTRGACRVIARFDMDEDEQPSSGDSSGSSDGLVTGARGGIIGRKRSLRPSMRSSGRLTKKKSLSSGLGIEMDQSECEAQQETERGRSRTSRWEQTSF